MSHFPPISGSCLSTKVVANRSSFEGKSFHTCAANLRHIGVVPKKRGQLEEVDRAGLAEIGSGVLSGELFDGWDEINNAFFCEKIVYWFALAFAVLREWLSEKVHDLSPQPDRREVVDEKWCNYLEAE